MRGCFLFSSSWRLAGRIPLMTHSTSVKGPPSLCQSHSGGTEYPTTTWRAAAQSDPILLLCAFDICMHCILIVPCCAGGKGEGRGPHWHQRPSHRSKSHKRRQYSDDDEIADLDLMGLTALQQVRHHSGVQAWLEKQLSA